MPLKNDPKPLKLPAFQRRTAPTDGTTDDLRFYFRILVAQNLIFWTVVIETRLEQLQQLFGERLIDKRQRSECREVQAGIELYTYTMNVAPHMVAAHHISGNPHPSAVRRNQRQLTSGIDMEIMAMNETHASTADVMAADGKVERVSLFAGTDSAQQKSFLAHFISRITSAAASHPAI